MSRFFKGSDSESDSSSDSEVNVPRAGAPAARPVAYAFSDDEDEPKRIVRSAKDKRFDELREIIKKMGNHKKIKDMASVLTDFEELGKAYEKAKKVIEKENQIPRFFLRCLVELEDFVGECWEDREGRKAMSKNNAKGLTTLRQKLKKYNRDFESDVASYRENPDEGEEEEAADSADEESEDEARVELSKAKSKEEAKASKKVTYDDDDDDDDSDWEMSSDSSSSESDGGEGPGTTVYTAAMFLKKQPGEEKKDKKEKKEKRAKKQREVDEGGEWEEVTKGAPMIKEAPKMFAKDTEVNHEAVVKKLNEIISARGKKGTDRNEQIALLTELQSISNANNLGPAISMKIMFHIIAAIYDYNPNIATCMRSEMWEKCVKGVGELLDMVEGNAEITIGEHILEENENVTTEPYRVRGCVLTVVERMDEEFTKMLQACDAHSTEYVDRLKDEKDVCILLDRLQAYLVPRGTTEEICRVYLRRIEHLYYKFDPEAYDNPEIENKYFKEMEEMCKFIYAKDLTDRLRTRSMLCQIYHQALHDRWYEARDLMLMSHLQDTIQHSDVPTQILYNRTMVQLGLCAFRKGSIRDAHNALVDIQSGGRAKELLAQGLLLQRQHERTPEQEKIEKRRLLPYHMHINLELLECVYLVSAMLIEVPYMAAHEMDARRRMISKNFHHVMRMSERQALTGPPESMREHVVAASKAMKTGNWKECKNFIINEKMNAKVWELFYKSDTVQEMVTGKIQEESLRTYLFTYSSVYDSLCLQTLADMFEIDTGIVHSIISKMIINEELMASLDEPTQTVIMHRTEPTRLQSLALQLSEKVSSLVDNNERIMELKQGNLFFQKSGGREDRQDRFQGNYQQNRNQNWQERRNQRQNYSQRAY
ncbi:eukaryotic translation initiation factor 3 subunit C-like isoform X1 [Ostrea edulis]|uniref:eukaryotic translation initiation factor 3 subunit C-like isoform X1 n=1 Tax=Ostrea edulis TaxID=37623 RepID=UPI0024AF6DD6|nr:eukaryotic translation initiation factor 3 subunit C-like isoform X1 [Ostrea edulis]XP_056016703.1 eukaryotic translation initiation factor 3 subunit C-like isoform X1 [Ostrea edulis]